MNTRIPTDTSRVPTLPMRGPDNPYIPPATTARPCANRGPYRVEGETQMTRSIDDQDGPLPGEAPGPRFPSRRVVEDEPTPERHPWIERIARVAKSTGIPLDHAAIDDATTLDIGVIPVADAFRLALAGLATDLGSFTRDGRRRWRIEIHNADDGEPVTATVLT